MKLEVVLTPHRVPPKLGAAVVIDVLRATSTITTALAHGVSSIHTTTSEEEARGLSRGEENFLLGGERQGIKIPGFQLGNSPAEYTREVVAGKKIIFTTTNGTLALARAKESRLSPILTGCFLNLSALVKRIKELQPTVLYLFCAGRGGDFSLEDAAFAGLLCQELGGELSDSAIAARAIWREWEGDILGLLAASEHGRYMQKIGFASDLQLCATVDKYQVVPQLQGSELVSIPEKNN